MYENITIQWPVSWARTFIDARVGTHNQSSQPQIFTFVYVSGEGATLQPGFSTPRYGPIKGQAEQALLNLSKEESMSMLKVYSARAGAVDRLGHTEIAKYAEAREGMQKKLEKPIKAILRPLWKSLMSPTVALGDALVQLASGSGEPLTDGGGVSGERRTVGNIALRKMAGL